ncbi:MAG: prolipoprotein diacylglyceryl transferase [Enterobacterales bacterium]|nr:prolipoprotein diacylglyceryl transferase [Enterobacterales bacterium]
MFPYIYQSNSLQIGSYGLMLAIAYLVGRWFYLVQLEKQQPPLKNTEALIILLLVFGVMGAKLMFIIKNPEQSHLLLNGMGFSSQGAILGAMLATWLFAKLNDVGLYLLLDAAAPAAILAYALARVGCFLSGDDCYGIATNLPWGMSFPDGISPTNTKVHPVPLYEIIYSLLIFIYLVKNQYKKLIPYQQFFTLLGLWGLSRFLVEFVSSNPKIVGFMSGSQFGAFLMFISALVFFGLNWKKVK